MASKIGKSIWGGLTMVATGGPSLSRLLFNRGDSGPLKYVVRKPGYNDVLTHRLRLEAVQRVAKMLKDLYPKHLQKKRMKALNYVRDQQEYNHRQIIVRGELVCENNGFIKCEGGEILRARNCIGEVVPEAMMLYYDGETPITVTESNYDDDERSFQTKTVCHIDLNPSITCSSSKNIVQTQVQGRDYSRKELVSGGDLEFKIDGNIMSFENGVYPTAAVKKFIQIMQYNGILNVNSFFFDQYNVKKLIVKDFSLGKPTYKNIQPYSFSCVAIEPDEDVRVVEDTIWLINTNIQTLSTKDAWYDKVLQNKFGLGKRLHDEAINAAIGSTAAITKPLEDLTKLI